MAEPIDQIVVGPEDLRAWARKLRKIAIKLEAKGPESSDSASMMETAAVLMEDKADELEGEESRRSKTLKQ